MDLPGLDQDYIPRMHKNLLSSGKHMKIVFHNAQDFPFRVEMRRPVFHVVKEDMQPADLRVLDDLKFVHFTLQSSEFSSIII